MPSRHPCSLTPVPLIFIAGSGPPRPSPSSHEINIHSHAESHPTHDGGFVYSSHTTITSESAPLPLPPPPPPPPYLPLPPVYGHHLPPSRQMSAVSSRGPRLALPPPPSIGPPPPPSYVSSPYTYTRSRSAAPSYASSSRTARPDSFYTPSLTTTATATGSSRRYPPVSSRGRSRLPQQVLMLCDAPPSSASSSQRRSRYSSVQDESTVAPESSVSNQTHNAERAARRDMEARGRASRRSSSQCR
ncbi:hypothetical protein NHJ13734_005769 [Beauveria thailandica]